MLKKIANKLKKIAELFRIYFKHKRDVLFGSRLILKLLGNHVFGGDARFYQSYERLGIIGNRNTSYRIGTYGLYEWIDEHMSILDIGCNMGFFDLAIADKVNSVVGLEYDKWFLEFGERVKKYEKINNVKFLQGDFKEYKTDEKFDMIFSFAVHKWIGLPLHDYFLRLSKLLNDDGVVLFESHGIDTYDEGLDEKMEELVSDIFTIKKKGIIFDGFKRPRNFYYLEKIN